VRAWLPALLAGTGLGLWLGAVAPSQLADRALFAASALALALKLGAGDRLVIAHTLPQGPLGQVPPAIVGALASAVGVGGGTLSTPVLSLFSFPIRRAISAGALFNLVIAAPATMFFLTLSFPCALCRAHRGPLVGSRAGRAFAPPVCLVSRGRRDPFAAARLKSRLGKAAELWLFSA
jgi:uncharacterized membrane protein YfcA